MAVFDRYRKGRFVMGVIQRFKDIMAANVNALLDKAEDPEKMIDQYCRDMQKELGNVKAETAAVMAEETRAKRQLDECTQEIIKMQTYAQKAVMAGNDEDAKQFLMKKKSLTEKQVSLQQAYDLAASNALKMKQMHDKLVSDIGQLMQRGKPLRRKWQWPRLSRKSIRSVPVLGEPMMPCPLLAVWKRRQTACWMKPMPWQN